MIIKIKNALGETVELECKSTFLLKSLIEKYKTLIEEKGKTINKITFTFNGEILDEDDMSSTLEEFGIEDGGLIVASILYNGGDSFKKYNKLFF